jgi:hypothetical protein
MFQASALKLKINQHTCVQANIQEYNQPTRVGVKGELWRKTPKTQICFDPVEKSAFKPTKPV